MIYVAIGSLATLTFLNARFGGGLLHPGTLFSAVWLISLLALLVAGDAFYPVSADTLAIYVVGAFALSAGSVLTRAQKEKAPVRPQPRARVSSNPASQIFLDLALLTVAVGLPFYVTSVTKGRDLLDPMFFVVQRTAALEASASSVRTFSALANFVNLSIFTALAMHHENDGTLRRRARAYAAIALAVAYGVMNGTKGNVVTLVLALAFISAVRAGKMSIAKMGAAVALSLGVFTVGLLAVNYAHLGLGVSWEAARLALQSVRTYWLGGLVAFDRVVLAPQSIEAVHNVGRSVMEIANGFGAHYEFPSLHAEYTYIGPGTVTNVYTIYFSYLPQFGVAGVVAGMSLTGFALAWIYSRAQSRRSWAMIVYSTLATGLLLSVQAEQFLLALNKYLKMAFFLVAAYGIAPMLSQRRPRVGNVTDA